MSTPVFNCCRWTTTKTKEPAGPSKLQRWWENVCRQLWKIDRCNRSSSFGWGFRFLCESAFPTGAHHACCRCNNAPPAGKNQDKHGLSSDNLPFDCVRGKGKRLF